MRWCVIFLLCLHGFLPAAGSRPKLRALVACDLVSTNIRRGSKADLKRVKTTLANIAHQLKIHYQITTLNKKNFQPKRIMQWLSSIPSHSNDIVFFYFSGHGGRRGKGQSKWPFVVFPQKNSTMATAVLGDAVYRYLRKKQPRLTIILLDSCNNVVQIKGMETLGQQILPAIERTPYLPGLKTLFLHSSGSIIASASSPGEVAYTTVKGKILGGIYTTGWLFSLRYFAENPNVRWDDVFRGASAFCQKFYQGKQTPQYSIHTSTS